jgi:hypothetical protein
MPPVTATPAEKRQKAIELVAAGKLSSEAIAKEVGCCRRTITAWKAEPEFQKAVKDHKNAWRIKVRTEGVGDRDTRLRQLNSLNKRLWAAVLKRGADPDQEDVPGYKTGVVTVTYKMQSLGEGLGSKAVKEYKIDNETPAEIRANLEQAALERGHREPRKKDAGSSTLTVAEYTEILNAGRQRVAEAKAKPLPRDSTGPQQPGV